MAETSGFQTDLPQSAYLSLSIERAISLAQQRSHRYVTLEHLLQTMLDDSSTIEILEGLNADIISIRSNIAETVNRGLTALYTPGQFDLHASYKVERVLQTASDDADRLNCEEVDAAFVIAALSRESDNQATEILKRNGVTYSNAVSWLYANRGATSPPARLERQVAPEPEEELIAGLEELPTPAPRQTPQGMPSAPVRGPASAAPANERYASEPPESVSISTPVLAEQEEAYEAPPELELAEDDLLELNEHVEEPAPNGTQHYPAEVQEVEQRPENAEKADGPPYDGQADTRSAPPQYGQRPQPVPVPAQPRPAPPRQGPPSSGYSDYRGGDQPLPAPAAPPVRSNGQMRDKPYPPVRRLDEMRLGKGRSALQGAPPPGKEKKAARKKSARGRASGGQAKQARLPIPAEGQTRRSRRPLRPHEVLVGRLVENIPRKMRAAVADRIEVRISREETHALLRGLEGRGEAVGHDISITSTMSVALRAPDGGFTIEPISPETQWIFARPDEADIYGRWRWVVTPHKRGSRRLQLLIASRSVGPNGIVGDTALPDQMITIRVRTNYWLTLTHSLQWIAAMVVGGIITELAIVGTRLFGL